MQNQKKIAKNGSITLPQAMRHDLGIYSGTPVDISTNADGSVTIRKHVPVCHLCGSVDNVAEVDGLGICRRCHCKYTDKFFGMKA